MSALALGSSNESVDVAAAGSGSEAPFATLMNAAVSARGGVGGRAPTGAAPTGRFVGCFRFFLVPAVRFAMLAAVGELLSVSSALIAAASTDDIA